jgi:F-type H+-transporting ATPase subunit b
VRREQEARLQTELAGMRTKAAADVESAKSQAIADLRQQVAELAIGAAEVVVQKNLDRETQTQLIDRYIESLSNRSN